MTTAEVDRLRRRMGWTRSELARQAGYTPRHVRRMFQGRNPAAIPPSLARWLRALVSATSTVRPPNRGRRSREGAS